MTIHLKITMTSPAESNMMKNASQKWAIFVNIFFHKMSYNIFTGYLSIGNVRSRYLLRCSRSKVEDEILREAEEEAKGQFVWRTTGRLQGQPS